MAIFFFLLLAGQIKSRHRFGSSHFYRKPHRLTPVFAVRELDRGEARRGATRRGVDRRRRRKSVDVSVRRLLSDDDDDDDSDNAVVDAFQMGVESLKFD